MFKHTKSAFAPAVILFPTPSERLLATEKATEARRVAGAVFRAGTDAAINAYRLACAAGAGNEEALARASEEYRLSAGEVAWAHSGELARIDATLRFALSPKCGVGSSSSRISKHRVVADAAAKHAMALRPRAVAKKL